MQVEESVEAAAPTKKQPTARCCQNRLEVNVVRV
jgi:hypothetical protein